MRTATYEIPPQEVNSSLSSHQNFVNFIEWIKKWPYASHRVKVRSTNSHYISHFMPVPKLSQNCLKVKTKLSPIFVKVVVPNCVIVMSNMSLLCQSGVSIVLNLIHSCLKVDSKL